MATYVLVYKGGASMPQTDEAPNATLAAWGKWYDKLGAAVVDGGIPFGPSATVASDGSTTEGAHSGLTGNTILKADNLAEASKLANGCPILTDGGSIEVYEMFTAM